MGYFESIRLTELDIVLDEIKGEMPGGNFILEIGGGTGWQAKKLSERGYAVEAIDIPQSMFSEQRIWPITDYDGKQIPFPNDHFDMVFSSSVLEHIAHLDEFQSEIKRVLKSNGLALHVVPSGSWRFWTNLVHYPFIVKTLVKLVFGKVAASMSSTSPNEMESLALSQMKRLSKQTIIKRAIFPPRHGEKGSAISEIYYFSRRNWLDMFRKSGWEIEKVSSNRLFYTGHMIFGQALSIQSRRKLSYILGSSCHIFRLRKKNISPSQQ